MKIIISPSKTMKPTKHHLQMSTPIFNEKSKPLKHALLNLSIEEIEKTFQVSNKLAQNIFNGLKDQTLYPALFYYTGTVFKQLELKNYTHIEFDYINTHLHILDALYGVLKYSDGISFYRLDYLSQLDTFNLYSYWQSCIDELYEDEDLIINLASNEFSKQIHHQNMVTIDFCIEENGKMKRPSMHVKKARGQMLNYLITHQITSLDHLKLIDLDGYCYDKNLSDEHHFVMIKSVKK